MDTRSRLAKGRKFDPMVESSSPRRTRSSTPLGRTTKSVRFNKHTLETTVGGSMKEGFTKLNNTECSIFETTGLSSSPEVRRSAPYENPSALFHIVPSPNRRFTLDSSIKQLETMKSDDQEDCRIVVAVRCRPLLDREKENDAKIVVSMQDNETTISHNSTVHKFVYEHSFWSCDPSHSNFSDQQRVYEVLAKPLIDVALKGFNTCLLAYGQTSSGKSHSMMGDEKSQGIIPRFCIDFFRRIANLSDDIRTKIELSFYEIYNEKIHDLFDDGYACPKISTTNTPSRKHLKVREHQTLGPYVEGLTSYNVDSADEALNWINVGLRNRATASTGMNDKSSRSHAVFTLVLTQTKGEAIEGTVQEHNVTSRINMVDLAGSERAAASGSTGERLQEGKSINLSLMTLGKVITQLSQNPDNQKSQSIYIPYRESQLTFLLKDSLGGNSKTAMLATISPASSNYEETISTLRYAQKARNIVNIVRVNEDHRVSIIRKLIHENNMLKKAMDPETRRKLTEKTNNEIQVNVLQKEIADVKEKYDSKISDLTAFYENQLEEKRNKNSKIESNEKLAEDLKEEFELKYRKLEEESIINRRKLEDERHNQNNKRIDFERKIEELERKLQIAEEDKRVYQKRFDAELDDHEKRIKRYQMNENELEKKLKDMNEKLSKMEEEKRLYEDQVREEKRRYQRKLEEERDLQRLKKGEEEIREIYEKKVEKLEEERRQCEDKIEEQRKRYNRKLEEEEREVERLKKREIEIEENSRKLYENKLKHEKESFHAKINAYEEKILLLKEEVKTLEINGEKVRKESEEQMENLNCTINNLEKELKRVYNKFFEVIELLKAEHKCISDKAEECRRGREQKQGVR